MERQHLCIGLQGRVLVQLAFRLQRRLLHNNSKLHSNASLMQFSVTAEPSSRGSDTFFWSPQVPGTYMQVNIHTKKIIVNKSFFKNHFIGAGKMSQELNTLTALPKDPGSWVQFPAPASGALQLCRESKALLWPLKTQTHRYTHIHINKYF